jgi:hypothetical protein
MALQLERDRFFSGIFVSDCSYDGKQRIGNQFTAAQRAFSGLLEPVPFAEDEPAPVTRGRSNLQVSALCSWSSDMFEVVANVSLRQSQFVMLCLSELVCSKAGDIL